MKKIILAGLLAVSTFAAPQAWAQVPDSVTTITTPQIEVVDTINTYEIGGAKFYLIANRLDSLYTNVRLVAASIKAQDPQNPGDWLRLLFELFASGVLASLFAQGIKIFNEAKQLVKSLPRSEWIVFVASVAIGGGWLYLEGGFADFKFYDLFTKSAGVFFIAVIAWRAGLSRIFKKSDPAAPVPPPATP